MFGSGGPPGCNQPECGWIDHNVSYDGLLYPIMTALTGLDNDGEPEPHWPSEDHMTGDISLAVQQVILPPAPAVSDEGRSSPLLALLPAGCFLALGSGLGLVGTASSRR